jgi:hypothetical protein
MSDERDPLEEELAGFRPQPVSPELRERIGQQLAYTRRARFRIRFAVGALTALAAASVFWLALPTASPPAPVRQRLVAREEQNQELPPTLAVYRQALDRSPDAMEQLMDRQAAALCRGEVSPITAIQARQSDSLWER